MPTAKSEFTKKIKTLNADSAKTLYELARKHDLEGFAKKLNEHTSSVINVASEWTVAIGHTK